MNTQYKLKEIDNIGNIIQFLENHIVIPNSNYKVILSLNLNTYNPENITINNKTYDDSQYDHSEIVISIADINNLFEILKSITHILIYNYINHINLYMNNFNLSINMVLSYFPFITYLYIYESFSELGLYNGYKYINDSQTTNISSKYLLKEGDANIITTKLNNLITLRICSLSFLPDDMDLYFPSLYNLYMHVDINDIDAIKNKRHKTIKVLEISIIHKMDDTNHTPNNFKSYELNNNKISYYDLDFNNIIGEQLSSFTISIFNLINTNYIITIDINQFIKCKDTLKKIEISGFIILNLDKLNNISNLEFLCLSDVNIINLYKNNSFHLSLNKLSYVRIVCSYNNNNNDNKQFILNLPEAFVIDLNKCLSEEPIFINCNKLEKLAISNNKIKKLTDKLFISLPNLEKLYCRNNEIEKIDGDINKCKKLNELAIDNNKLKILPKRLHSIQILSCEQNPLLTIDNVVFKDIHNINILDTNIKRITLESCETLPNLNKIVCDIDKMSFISSKLIDYCKSN